MRRRPCAIVWHGSLRRRMPRSLEAESPATSLVIAPLSFNHETDGVHTTSRAPQPPNAPLQGPGLTEAAAVAHVAILSAATQLAVPAAATQAVELAGACPRARGGARADSVGSAQARTHLYDESDRV